MTDSILSEALIDTLIAENRLMRESLSYIAGKSYMLQRMAMPARCLYEIEKINRAARQHSEAKEDTAYGQEV